jgi:hypothetical protein
MRCIGLVYAGLGICIGSTRVSRTSLWGIPTVGAPSRGYVSYKLNIYQDLSISTYAQAEKWSRTRLGCWPIGGRCFGPLFNC